MQSAYAKRITLRGENMDKILLMHISDLHFAKEVYPQWGAGGPTGGRPLPPSLVRAPIQGFFPHCTLACRELQNELTHQLRSVRPDLALVTATGDLTVEGDDSEFSLAFTYLRSRLHQDLTRRLGLGTLPSGPEVLAIPGNHDHWGGTKSFLWRTGPNLSIHGIYFESPSGQACWHKVYDIGNLRLQVMGLDSNSQSVSTGHKFARGYIDTACLATLEREIARNDAAGPRRNVRVLMVHHSLDSSGTHALEPASKVALETFCKTRRIHGVLTGHAHEPLMPQSALVTFGRELRCGTTLQGAPHGKIPSKFGNTFMLHEISDNGAAPRWKTRLFQRGSGSFREVEDCEWRIP